MKNLFTLLSIAALGGLGSLSVSCQTTGIDSNPDVKQRLGKAHPGHPYSDGFEAGRNDAQRGIRPRPEGLARNFVKPSERNAFRNGYMAGWKQSKPERFQSDIVLPREKVKMMRSRRHQTIL